MQDKKVCKDPDTIYLGYFYKLRDCAVGCYGLSEFFQYATNRYNEPRCNDDGSCRCYCKTKSINYECSNWLENKGYMFYRFINPTKGMYKLLVNFRRRITLKRLSRQCLIQFTYMCHSFFSTINNSPPIFCDSFVSLLQGLSKRKTPRISEQFPSSYTYPNIPSRLQASSLIF